MMHRTNKILCTREPQVHCCSAKPVPDAAHSSQKDLKQVVYLGEQTFRTTHLNLQDIYTKCCRLKVRKSLN